MWLDVAQPAALIAGCRPASPDIAARLLPVLLPNRLIARCASVSPVRVARRRILCRIVLPASAVASAAHNAACIHLGGEGSRSTDGVPRQKDTDSRSVSLETTRMAMTSPARSKPQYPRRQGNHVPRGARRPAVLAAMLSCQRAVEVARYELTIRRSAVRERSRGRGPGRRSQPDRTVGVGPIIAAAVIAGVGDVSRFPGRDRFVTYNGIASIEASSASARSTG
jgi:hypothetical protein